MVWGEVRFRVKQAHGGKEFPDYQIIEASLIRNFGLKQIKEAVIPTLKEGEPFYPDDMITDKDPAYQAKEVIRQELLHFLKQEIPHQSAVKIDSFEKIDGGFRTVPDIPAEKDNVRLQIVNLVYQR